MKPTCLFKPACCVSIQTSTGNLSNGYLSTQEVAAIVKAIENVKHKAILAVIYSTGLRIRELVNSKIRDIGFKRMQIRAGQSKGKKESYTLLSPKTLELLRTYLNYLDKTIRYLVNAICFVSKEILMTNNHCLLTFD
jgi:site-specific recombinase XerD